LQGLQSLQDAAETAKQFITLVKISTNQGKRRDLRVRVGGEVPEQDYQWMIDM